MAKYDPLRRYLARQKSETVTLSFSAIEALIGGLLPKSAGRPECWLTYPDAMAGIATATQGWDRPKPDANLMKRVQRLQAGREIGGSDRNDPT